MKNEECTLCSVLGWRWVTVAGYCSPTTNSLQLLFSLPLLQQQLDIKIERLKEKTVCLRLLLGSAHAHSNDQSQCKDLVKLLFCFCSTTKQCSQNLAHKTQSVALHRVFVSAMVMRWHLVHHTAKLCPEITEFQLSNSWEGLSKALRSSKMPMGLAQTI